MRPVPALHQVSRSSASGPDAPSDAATECARRQRPCQTPTNSAKPSKKRQNAANIAAMSRSSTISEGRRGRGLRTRRTFGRGFHQRRQNFGRAAPRITSTSSPTVKCCACRPTFGRARRSLAQPAPSGILRPCLRINALAANVAYPTSEASRLRRDRRSPSPSLPSRLRRGPDPSARRHLALECPSKFLALGDRLCVDASVARAS